MDQNPKPKPKPKPSPWPNLHQNVINSIAANPELMQNTTSFSCVVKSWRSLAKNCNQGKFPCPKLVEIIEKDKKNQAVEIRLHKDYLFWYIYIKKKQLSYRSKTPPLVHFVGHDSHGQLVAMESECCLWKPWKYRITHPCWRYVQYLPWIGNRPCKSATLSSEINDPNGCSVMAITGISSPAFAFFRYRKNQSRWIFEDCELKESYGVDESMKFTNCIGFGGKFYALSLQGTVVVVEDDVGESRFRVTGVGAGRAVPLGVSRQFREYLVECGGEILLVFLVSRKSIGFVEDVEVFRLDLGRLVWVKVESLGCMVLILEDECRLGVNASEVGCKRNCIYFTHCRIKEWCVYDMEKGEISGAFGTI